MSRNKPAIPPDESRDRIDLRAEPAFVSRVRRQAERMGTSASAYIREATVRRLEADEATDPNLTDA